jgi:hypothetical protein
MDYTQELPQKSNLDLTTHLSPEKVFLRSRDYCFNMLGKEVSVTVTRTGDFIAGFPPEEGASDLSCLAYINGPTTSKLSDIKNSTSTKTEQICIPRKILDQPHEEEFGIISFTPHGGTLMSDGVVVATVENQLLLDAYNQELGWCIRFPKDTIFLPNGKFTSYEQQKFTKAYLTGFSALWVYENIIKKNDVH